MEPAPGPLPCLPRVVFDGEEHVVREREARDGASRAGKAELHRRPSSRQHRRLEPYHDECLVGHLPRQFQEPWTARGQQHRRCGAGGALGEPVDLPSGQQVPHGKHRGPHLADGCPAQPVPSNAASPGARANFTRPGATSSRLWASVASTTGCRVTGLVAAGYRATREVAVATWASATKASRPCCA